MEPAASHGQIITFYSYKGGTGRTMAIANIACLLAQSYSKRVLVIDWDLEAPGLHRYFRNPIVGTPSWRVRSRAIDDDTHPGLIELLTELRRLVQLDLGITDEFHSEPKEIQSQDRAADCVAQLNFDPYLSAAPMKGVFVLKAGAFNDSYSHKISVFPWEDLYKASPWIFTAFADKLAQMFDFVLIDSRTGLTD